MEVPSGWRDKTVTNTVECFDTDLPSTGRTPTTGGVLGSVLWGVDHPQSRVSPVPRSGPGVGLGRSVSKGGYGKSDLYCPSPSSNLEWSTLS